MLLTFLDSVCLLTPNTTSSCKSYVKTTSAMTTAKNSGCPSWAATMGLCSWHCTGWLYGMVQLCTPLASVSSHMETRTYNLISKHHLEQMLVSLCFLRFNKSKVWVCWKWLVSLGVCMSRDWEWMKRILRFSPKHLLWICHWIYPSTTCMVKEWDRSSRPDLELSLRDLRREEEFNSM